MQNKTVWLILLFLSSFQLFAQNKATIFGTVVDEKENPIPLVTIGVIGEGVGVFSNNDGTYEIKVPAKKNMEIIFSFLGYKEDTIKVGKLRPNEQFQLNTKLFSTEFLLEQAVVTAQGGNSDDISIETLDAKPFEFIPTPSMNLDITSIGIGITGSADELSSQYSVRGGSYDENLVYVNDFEIYRPFLIRSGQQEGLTFPNVDLIRSLAFSAGGFQSRFGDKLSSVLDIKYKQPDSLAGSASLSFLGATAHLEGSIKKKKNPDQRFRFLMGTRYKTTRYVLGSLQTTGEYLPNFVDVQAYASYDLSDTWQLAWIGNVNRSQFQFRPDSRATALGLVNAAFQFSVDFEGQEVDDFTTYMTGISLSHVPKDKNYYFKFLASTFHSLENERIDIIGDYELGILETDLSDDEAGEVVGIIGQGIQHTFARNYLTARVSNVEWKGGWQKSKERVGSQSTSNHIRYGVKYQYEIIQDELNEWERLDSALYSLAYSDTQVNLFSTVKANVDLRTHRVNGFIQNTWKNTKSELSEYGFTIGLRASYWSENQDIIITPRAQFYYKPLNTKNSVLFKASVGAYYQPPFYREMRNQLGVINTNLKAQKSIHGVLGVSYDFEMWGRPFKFISEAYYKHLIDIVPFDLDNVRIRYYGDNIASGYSAGIDFRLNGEFIPGTESWINLSFLRTREKFDGVDHASREFQDSTATSVRDVARPNDQLVSLSMFFQDFLPKREDFKVNLNLVVGAGLPFGPPNDNVIYRNTYRYSPYYRVDIGFGYLLWDAIRRKERGKRNPFNRFDKAWLSFEVFNLLGVANAASNTWVKTIQNQQLAVPNYLTSRRINLRMKINF